MTSANLADVIWIFIGGTHPIGRFMDYRVANTRQLHDDWEYTPDEEAARLMFGARADAADAGVEYADLCMRCRSLSLFSLNCSFSDTYEGLIGKFSIDNCALCCLLSSGINGRPQAQHDRIDFVRAGSNIIAPTCGDSPIATLCRPPG